jgi:hypothetical protein
MSNNVNIIYSPSGLGTPAVGEDFISGMIFYPPVASPAVMPSGFTSGIPQEIFGLSQAEGLGITNTSIGETKASGGGIAITAAGATGDTVTISINTGSMFGTIVLGTYANLASDSINTVAAGARASINANNINGFTATGTGANVTIVAPAGTGVAGNAFLPVVAVTGAITTASPVVLSGGVASNIDPMWYHISEFFRANPTGTLWTMVMATSSASSSYSEIQTIQTYAAGKIRQVGIFETVAFSSTYLGLMQTQAHLLETNNKPLEVVYQGNFKAVSDLTSLTDLNTLTAQNVTATFAQDGGNSNLGGGFRMFLASGYTIGSVGLTLGAVSSALVSTSIAWIQNFNMDGGTEMDTLAFANGTLLTAVSDNLINNIDSKNYVFIKKFVGIAGSYFNNNYTSVVTTSDYSNISNNRTIHKAARNVRARILPSLASPVYFNSDGSIALYSIAFFQDEANTALSFMQAAGEISQYNVIINAKQNVLSTKTLTMNVQIVPVGVANIININLGFVLSV